MSPAARAAPRWTKRLAAKEATRVRVLDAAEVLFSERGWDATTLRDVAGMAEASTGAIFSSFADKAELFHAVLERDLGRLVDEMTRTIEADRPVEAALLETFMAGYSHYDRKTPFLRAIEHVMWAEHGGPARDLLAKVPFFEMFGGRLRKAVADGELRDERIAARAHMLVDAYSGNYVHMLYGAWDLRFIRKRAASQIGIILEGARPR